MKTETRATGAMPGVLRWRDLARQGMSAGQLRAALKSGRLERVGRGLYEDPEGPYTEKHSFARLACRVPKAIFCLISALAFHELTSQIDYVTWIALPPKTRPPKVGNLLLQVMHFSGPLLTEGVETHVCEGIPVQVYSPAKTVADLFRCRDTIGLDVALEALEVTWLDGRATSAEILSFARRGGVEELLRPYLEDVSSREQGELRWSGA